jgi:ketosteroid isomerase-like protein
MAAFQDALARRDVEAAAAVLDDEYALVLVQPAPATMVRARWLEVLPDYVIHAYAVEESVVDVDAGGDLAGVLHRDHMVATVLGQPRDGTFVLTDVWRRRDGVWRLWRRHSTPLSAGTLPG